MKIIDSNGFTYEADTVEELVALYYAVKEGGQRKAGDGQGTVDIGQLASDEGWIAWDDLPVKGVCPIDLERKISVIYQNCDEETGMAGAFWWGRDENTGGYNISVFRIID